MPVVGSSSTIRSLSPAVARAKRTRWAWPPESLLTLRSAICAMPARAITSPTLYGFGCKSQASLTSSPTVTSSISPPLWSIAPTRPATMASRGLVPKTSTFPVSACLSPSSRSRAVDFPAPFGPSRATVSPGAARATARRRPAPRRSSCSPDRTPPPLWSRSPLLSSCHPSWRPMATAWQCRRSGVPHDRCHAERMTQSRPAPTPPVREVSAGQRSIPHVLPVTRYL